MPLNDVRGAVAPFVEGAASLCALPYIQRMTLTLALQFPASLRGSRTSIFFAANLFNRNSLENKMKLKSILLAATLTAFSATAVYAADDAMMKKEDAPKAEKAEAKKPVKKHSHMTEKTGIPASEAPAGKSHRETMDKDMPMHDHTKDRH